MIYANTDDLVRVSLRLSTALYSVRGDLSPRERAAYGRRMDGLSWQLQAAAERADDPGLLVRLADATNALRRSWAWATGEPTGSTSRLTATLSA